MKSDKFYAIAYLVIERNQFNSVIGRLAQEIWRAGFQKLGSDINAKELMGIAENFDYVYSEK